MKMRLHGETILNIPDHRRKILCFVSAVDTSYPIQDSFYAENQLFEKYASSGTVIAVLGMIAFGMSDRMSCVAYDSCRAKQQR